MPKLVRTVCAYRLHRSTGQAVVTLGGKDFYLGRHGTTESRREYDRLTAEWLANGRMQTVLGRSGRFRPTRN
jgi:hypothetical protein